MSLADKRRRAPSAVFEPPAYIQQLIGSINDGAKSAQLGALAFVAIGLFLLATSFSATDEDLLIGNSIVVAQLGGVTVPAALSFGFMPIIFVSVHVYTLVRFDMVAGNVQHLNSELRDLVRREVDRERCRQLLANVEFIQVLATPNSSLLYRFVFWFIIGVFPVLVLMTVQLGSLRLQSNLVTNIHHSAIIGDLALFVWFTLRLRGIGGSSRPTNGIIHVGPAGRPKLVLTMVRIFRLLIAPFVVIGCDLAWCRVPTPEATTVGMTIEDKHGPIRKRQITKSDLKFRSGDTIFGGWTRVAGVLFEQPVDLLLCPNLDFGCRFLSVPHRLLVAKIIDGAQFAEMRSFAISKHSVMADKHKGAFEPITLRDRSLMFADLSYSELYRADLTGAQLQGAHLTHAYVLEADLRDARLDGANLWGTFMQGSNLTRAVFNGATLDNTRMMETNISSANFLRVCKCVSVAWNIKIHNVEKFQASYHNGLMPFFESRCSPGENLRDSKPVMIISSPADTCPLPPAPEPG